MAPSGHRKPKGTKSNIYSPTSPASDDGHSSAPANVTSTSPPRVAVKYDPHGTEEIHNTDDRGTEDLRNTDERGTEELKGTDNLDTEDGTDGVPRIRGRNSDPCPKLWAGTQLAKAVSLIPNRWLKIGRNPKATLLINNPGVSREHCSVRWDSHLRRVELKVDTLAGTLVNGVQAEGDRVILEHADRLRVVGKNKNFDFVVDLRPVGLGWGAPQKTAADAQKAKERPMYRRQMLRARLHKLEMDIRQADQKIMDAESEFYDLQTKREIRLRETSGLVDQHTFYIEDAKKLEAELENSRQAWLQKLEGEYKANEDAVRPIIQETGGLQDKIEKLQLKKDELSRSIHPELYAVADVAVLDIPSPAASFVTDAQDMVDGIGREDVEGEDDAFAGLAGLEETRAASASEDEAGMLKRGHDDVFSEQDAKKARMDDDEDMVPKGIMLD